MKVLLLNYAAPEGSVRPDPLSRTQYMRWRHE